MYRATAGGIAVYWSSVSIYNTYIHCLGAPSL